MSAAAGRSFNTSVIRVSAAIHYRTPPVNVSGENPTQQAEGHDRISRHRLVSAQLGCIVEPTRSFCPLSRQQRDPGQVSPPAETASLGYRRREQWAGWAGLA